MSGNDLAWVAVVILGAAHVVAWGRLHYYRWRGRRESQRRDFCEVCGKRPRRIYVVSTSFADGHALGIEDATMMSATYCKAHAPDEARRKANPIA